MKYISHQEFRDKGYLQEVNRRFFHPLGLALAMQWDRYDGPVFFEGIQDHRDESEGVYFAFHTDEEQDKFIEKFVAIKEEWHARKRARVLELGFMVQPVPETVDELDSDIIELLAQALAAEMRSVIPVKAESESWRKAARGILEKLSESIFHAAYDPAEVTPEEVHIIDLVLAGESVGGSRTRLEAVNMVADRARFYKDMYETAASALAFIAKDEFPEGMNAQKAADMALSDLVGEIGG